MSYYNYDKIRSYNALMNIIMTNRGFGKTYWFKMIINIIKWGVRMNEVSNLITNLGFPIVCVIACAYFINYIIKAEREENQKREEKYIDTINKFSVVLEKVNDNLSPINKRLEYFENKLDEVSCDKVK